MSTTQTPPLLVPLFFSYDPYDGIDFHDTAEEAKKRAQKAKDFAELKADHSDGYSDDNQHEISWGQVFGYVEVDERELTPEEKKDHPEWDFVRDLTWVDLQPPPSELTAQNLIANYQHGKEILQHFKRTTFPSGSRVWVDTPQYIGPGTVTVTSDCPPHYLAVMLENGNTWFYPLECCQPHPKES